MTAPVLDIRGLRVAFGRGSAAREVVHGVDLCVMPGERLALVGESGSGKSVTALAAMRLLGRSGRIAGGSVRIGGDEVTALSEPALRPLRGRRMAMIFQDPNTALNPAITVGRQIVDVIRAHDDPGPRAARDRAAELLARVGIADPVRRMGLHPHELSGGMRQRVMIAMAVACRPVLLFADEPTTALDVTVQAQVIALLRDLCEGMGIALLFISHNLDLVAEFCDRIAVMYRGRIVETGTAEQVFATPRHPYTRLLLDAVPRPGRPIVAVVRPEGEAPAGACDFLPRCPIAIDRCRARPDLTAGADHAAACWREGES